MIKQKQNIILLTSSLLTITPSHASQELDIKESVNNWVNNGKDLSSMSQCNVTSESNGDNIFYYSSGNCISEQLTAYILLNECANYKHSKNITILDTKSGQAKTSFIMDSSSCTSFEQLVLEPSKPKRPKVSVKEYAIQFYSGKRKPNENYMQCVDIPLYVLNENNMFYLLSQNFSNQSEAKDAFNTVKAKCNGKLDAWIRPIYVAK